MELNQFKIDLDKESNGIWSNIFAEKDGVKVKVRPINNPDYRHLESKLFLELGPDDRDGTGFKREAIERVQAECLLETILVDWEGLTEDKQPLPYSKDTARRLLLDRAFSVFRGQVIAAAERASHAVIGVTETDEKN